MTRSLIVATTGLLLASAAANAEFTGVGLHNPDNDYDLYVCQFSATFDNPNDILVAVAGTPGNPLSIETAGGPFYQNPFGGDEAPGPALIAVFPSLEFDSFVTIGKTTSTADQTGLTPGWPGFGTSSLSGTNLGWFITPDQPQGLPVDGKVVFGQFTTEGATISGQALIQYVTGGTSFQTYIDFGHIPTPGALALLGLAGLTTRRRRVA